MLTLDVLPRCSCSKLNINVVELYYPWQNDRLKKDLSIYPTLYAKSFPVLVDVVLGTRRDSARISALATDVVRPAGGVDG